MTSSRIIQNSNKLLLYRNVFDEDEIQNSNGCFRQIAYGYSRKLSDQTGQKLRYLTHKIGAGMMRQKKT